MSDNRGKDSFAQHTDNNGQEQKTPQEDPPAPPPGAWQQTLDQLQAIGQQVSKLDKIEKTTDRLSQQMDFLVNRTTSLENFAQQATDRFSHIEADISKINETAVKTCDLEDRLDRIRKDLQQENDKRITDLQQEIHTHKTHIEAFKKTGGQP